MTIRKGEQWGAPRVRPPGLPLAASDSELARFRGELVGVAGGDMWTVLGKPNLGAVGSECTAVLVDRLEVAIVHRSDERRLGAASHVRVGSWMGPGRLVVVTNVGTWGRWRVAPRAHPNDGSLHVMEVGAELGVRERLMARHRARTGDHVPHPAISVNRATVADIQRRGREQLWVDGVRMGSWTAVKITVRSDDLSVLI